MNAMAIEAKEMFEKLADVCTLNPQVSMKILKMHGLFSKDILEFLFFETGVITIEEAICVAYDLAEKKKFWRRAKTAMSVNGFFRVSDIIKIPQQYYEILQRRDNYISLSDTMIILGVSRRTLYAILIKLGIKTSTKAKIDLDAFRKVSMYLTNGICINDAAYQLGVRKPTLYKYMKKHGISANHHGYIMWNDFEVLMSSAV